MTENDAPLDRTDERPSQWLDDEHVLEPVDPEGPLPGLLAAPVVRDARGRLWKVRRRPRGCSHEVMTLSLVAVMLLAVRSR